VVSTPYLPGMAPDPLWLHELGEARHRILNPFSEAKVLLLGEICAAGPDTRVLDLACGKGELLCRWAQAYGSHGIGVDISEAFLAAARARAAGLDVSGKVAFVHGDAGAYQAEPPAFDVACCVGATWIGGGVPGTIELLRRSAKPDGFLLVGEPFWHEPHPDDREFATLAGTVDRMESAGAEVVELVAASTDDWDRFVAAQWLTLSDWLRDHAGDPRAPEVQAYLHASRRTHVEHRRRRMGWGVFVLRPASR
jgi:SAM-dependent methyltransferase